MRTATVLGQRIDHRLALHVVFAAPARALQVGERAVDIAAHLLDLAVEPAALRRLLHEDGEQGGRLAAEPLVLRLDAIEVGLLLAERVLDAAGLVGACGIGTGTIDGSELALEPHADGVPRLRLRHGRQPEQRQCNPSRPVAA